jgi:hypothetical protein
MLIEPPRSIFYKATIFDIFFPFLLIAIVYERGECTFAWVPLEVPRYLHRSPHAFFELNV